jgi:hypothetical protein
MGVFFVELPDQYLVDPDSSDLFHVRVHVLV